MNDHTDPPESMRPLIEAGFTADELRSISDDLLFAVTLAEAGESADIPASGRVDWTPEKRAAWNAAGGQFIRARHPDDEQE